MIVTPPRPRRRRRAPLAVATLALSLLVSSASCASTPKADSGTSGSPGSTEAAKAGIGNSGLAEDADATPVDGGKLVIGVANETSGWNPTVNQWAQWGSVVGSSILEPLAILDDKAQPQPWLAEKYEPNATFDTWTLTLRQGVTFHDGTPFDAAAVKRNIDNATTAPLSGAAIGKLFKQVTVVDDKTVKVELTEPWAAFPSSYLAGQSAMMMSPKALDSEDVGQKHPVGTGPFVFDEWKPDQHFRANKNTAYWRKGEPHVDQIEFRVIVDPVAQVNALKAKDIDMFFSTSAQAARDTQDAYAIVRNYETEPAMIIANTLAEVNGQPNPLGNLHARLALAYATDRRALAAILGDDVKSPTSPFSPENPWGQPEDQNGYPEHDLAKAKQEVATYEKDTGQSGLTIKLTGSLDPQSNQVLQVVQEQWKAAGIESSIENIETAAFIPRVVSGNYQAALFPIYTSPDPDQNWYFWSSSTANGQGAVSINFSQFKSPKIDAALATGRQNPSVAERKAAYSALVKELNANAVNIWLYWTPYALIAQKNVHGLKDVATTPFATFQPKTWFGRLWLAR